MSSTLPAPIPPKQIRQHNALTIARYDYSELQLDFLFFLLSKLRPDTNNIVYHLQISELTELTNKTYNNKYLYQATKEMGSRMFEVKLDNIDRQVWMFQSVDYHVGKGTIEVTLSEKILPLLFDLKGNFTSYELKAALKLSSKYAKRIYQICSQWKDKKQTQMFDIYELKDILGLINDGKEAYPLFGSFKQQVLSTAIKQINRETDLEIGLLTEKKGKAYTAVGFSLKVKPYNLSIEYDNSNKPAPPAPHGISHSQFDNAERFLDEVNIVSEKLRHQILSDPAHLKKLFKFAFDYRQGTVKADKNPGGLLLKILGLVGERKK